MPLIATKTSTTTNGGTITEGTSPKLKINGLEVAILNSVVTYPSDPPDTIVTELSTKLKVGGVPVAIVGSKTTQEDAVITGQAKLTIL